MNYISYGKDSFTGSILDRLISIKNKYVGQKIKIEVLSFSIKYWYVRLPKEVYKDLNEDRDYLKDVILLQVNDDFYPLTTIYEDDTYWQYFVMLEQMASLF